MARFSPSSIQTRCHILIVFNFPFSHERQLEDRARFFTTFPIAPHTMYRYKLFVSLYPLSLSDVVRNLAAIKQINYIHTSEDAKCCSQDGHFRPQFWSSEMELILLHERQKKNRVASGFFGAIFRGAEDVLRGFQPNLVHGRPD